MLAKVWKKALLAVCIIACIYNVMSKLVNRTSLEVQLRSVQMTTADNKTSEKTSIENTINNEENFNDKNIIYYDESITENDNSDDDSIVVLY